MTDQAVNIGDSKPPAPDADAPARQGPGSGLREAGRPVPAPAPGRRAGGDPPPAEAQIGRAHV